MRPSNAPGCFGIGITSMMNSKVCKICPAKKTCADGAIASLQEVSKTIDVGDYLATHKVTPSHNSPTIERHFPSKKINLRKADELELKMLFSLPVKARKVANTIVKKNINLRECVERNINPFENSTPRYLDLAFKFILSAEQFDKDDLTAIYTRLDWAQGTVRAAVADTLNILTAMSVLHTEDSKHYKVLRNE